MKINFDREQTIRYVEEEGFRDGAQEVEPTAPLAELNAMFAQQQAAVRHDATDTIKALEAKVSVKECRQSAAEGKWRELSVKTGELPPAVMLPIVAVLASLIAVIAEAIFLAPVMDGFGIPDPTWQYILAGGLVITIGGLFELSKKLYHDLAEVNHDLKNNGEVLPVETSPNVPDRPRWVRRAKFGACVFVTLFMLALAGTLGWWRADELIFAASAGSSDVQDEVLSSFLGDNSELTHLVVTLLTVGLPLFVMFAFEWGLDKFRFALEWRKARREYKRLPPEVEAARKLLEAAAEKRDQKLAAIDEKREEWKQAYLQNHELGRSVGAWRLPVWQVVIKIAAVFVLTLAACLVLNLLVSSYVGGDGFAATRYMIVACATLCVTGFYAYHALLAWDRPTPSQLYRQRATVWRNTNGINKPRYLPQPDVDDERINIPARELQNEPVMYAPQTKSATA